MSPDANYVHRRCQRCISLQRKLNDSEQLRDVFSTQLQKAELHKSSLYHLLEEMLEVKNVRQSSSPSPATERDASKASTLDVLREKNAALAKRVAQLMKARADDQEFIELVEADLRDSRTSEHGLRMKIVHLQESLEGRQIELQRCLRVRGRSPSSQIVIGERMSCGASPSMQRMSAEEHLEHRLHSGSESVPREEVMVLFNRVREEHQMELSALTAQHLTSMERAEVEIHALKHRLSGHQQDARLATFTAVVEEDVNVAHSIDVATGGASRGDARQIPSMSFSSRSILVDVDSSNESSTRPMTSPASIRRHTLQRHASPSPRQPM